MISGQQAEENKLNQHTCVALLLLGQSEDRRPELHCGRRPHAGRRRVPELHRGGRAPEHPGGRSAVEALLDCRLARAWRERRSPRKLAGPSALACLPADAAAGTHCSRLAVGAGASARCTICFLAPERGVA